MQMVCIWPVNVISGLNRKVIARKMISKILRHIKQGTLLERFKKRKLYKKEKEWARFLASDQEWFDMITDNGAILRLPKSMGSSKKHYVYDAEKDEVNLITALLNEGDTFLDIGAHIGYFTVSAAQKLVYGTGQVFSFEPTPTTLERLRTNIKANDFKNVTVCNKALSDKPGITVIYENPLNDGYNSLASAEMPATATAVEIETITLDSFALENDLMGKTDIIKIDVEGWERFVFMGAHQLLTQQPQPLIMLEFSEKNQRAAGGSCKELRDLLKTYGYELYLMTQGDNRPVLLPETDFYTEVYNPFAVADPDSFKRKLKAL